MLLLFTEDSKDQILNQDLYQCVVVVVLIASLRYNLLKIVTI